MTDKRLILFSILSTVMSGIFGLVNRFFEAVNTIDIRIVFYSGILLLFVLFILGYFLVRDLISKIKSGKLARKRSRKKK